MTNEQVIKLLWAQLVELQNCEDLGVNAALRFEMPEPKDSTDIAGQLLAEGVQLRAQDTPPAWQLTRQPNWQQFEFPAIAKSLLGSPDFDV